MNARERFRRMFAGEPLDRPWMAREGAWRRTWERWRDEGMTDEDRKLLDFDGLTVFKVRDMAPPFEPEVIADEGDKLVTRSASGQIVRSWKTSEEHDPGYQVLESPVKDLAGWDAIKHRLDPEHPDHLGDDLQERVREIERSGKPVRLDAGHSLSIFGFSRELMGDEIYLLFYDQPALVHAVMDFLGERMARLIERVSEHVQIDGVFIWEDMAYKGAPLISPEMFREFMLEPTRRVCEAARRCNASCISVDSDGDVTKLIPLWLEAGANVIDPFEVAAGMDVNRVRERFGDGFFMSGGFDKRALFHGRAEIDAEFERLRPALRRGKYLLSVDHSIPPEVSWDNCQYYVARKREIIVEEHSA